MKNKKAIAVIGEGITEKYYIESLRGLTPFNIIPKVLNKKASSLPELEQNIKDAIAGNNDEVYCLIDMDTKNNSTTSTKYKEIKDKYHHHNTHSVKENGVQCKVVFIESERCTVNNPVILDPPNPEMSDPLVNITIGDKKVCLSLVYEQNTAIIFTDEGGNDYRK